MRKYQQIDVYIYQCETGVVMKRLIHTGHMLFISQIHWTVIKRYLANWIGKSIPCWGF